MSIISWFTNKSVEGFARGIAKTQLRTLRSLQKRNPALTGGFLYEQVITLRPGYNSEKAKKIIQEAQESFVRTGWMSTEEQKKYGFGFRDVVSALITEEYFKNKTTTRNDTNAVTIILMVVREIIPGDI